MKKGKLVVVFDDEFDRWSWHIVMEDGTVIASLRDYFFKTMEGAIEAGKQSAKEGNVNIAKETQE